MYKLVITELAHQDLDRIVSYIVVQLSNSKAAGDFLDEVTACYGFLKSTPMMYERCQDRRLGEERYRKAVIKNYVLVYKISANYCIVNIMCFFYSAQAHSTLI